MRKFVLIVFAALCAGASLVCLGARGAEEPLRFVGKIPLPGVNGRIDHMAVDMSHKRLFIAALGNGTVEVVDLTAGKRVRSLSGFHEPQGVGYDRRANVVIVANGGSGDCVFLDGATFRVVGKLHLGDDCDDIRVDERHHITVVGYGDGALAFVNASKRQLIGGASFRGHPEAFAFGAAGSPIYINIPSGGKIAVVDAPKRKVAALWPVTAAADNFPMALDEAGHRLFVGCRNPARLLVFDTATAKAVADLPIGEDTDDVYFDPAHKLIYVSCGGGTVDIIQQIDKDRYRRVASVPTASGARTSLFVPELKRLYVAVPHRGGQPAEILVFATQP